MKKILYSIFTVALVLPIAASAATFSFAPASGAFAPGKTFSVVVFVNPSAGEKITTVKLSAAFPANLVEVVSFSQATGWIPLTVPGSDLTDNINGKLLKTGGFPARVDTLKQFGTIFLKAKKAGKATISVEGDSMMLDTANTNKYSASTDAIFTIATPAPASKPVVISNPEVEEIQKVEAISTTSQISEDNDATITTNDAATSSALQEQTAAVATAGTNSKTVWYYILAAAVILTGVFAWRKWMKKSRNNS